MGTSNDMGDIVIIDDGQEIVLQSSEDQTDDQTEDIVVVTPASSEEPSETEESTEAPDYSADALLIAENQVNGLAVQTAFTGLILGFWLGIEVLKIWLTGSR